jgi:crotonobetainyl-CoA:carnitine CoA-transferase CaiB-like acyl-CoA transferase
MLGEHTDQILCDVLGYDQQTIQRLRDAQVI